MDETIIQPVVVELPKVGEEPSPEQVHPKMIAKGPPWLKWVTNILGGLAVLASTGKLTDLLPQKWSGLAGAVESMGLILLLFTKGNSNPVTPAENK